MADTPSKSAPAPTPTPTSAPAPARSPLGTPEPWELVADAYDAELVPYFTLFSRDALARAQLPPAARVADVACGPGTLTVLAAAAGARVSALDQSPRMMAALRARVAAAGVEAAVDAQVGDGQRLPFDSGAYDAAFSMFGLMFFPDRAAGFRELLRLLRPGGRAVVSSWAPFDGPFGVLLSTVNDLIPGLNMGQGKPPLSDPEVFRAEMAAAGFSSVDVDLVEHELTAPSFDAFWDGMLRSNAPVVLLRHRLGERWDTMGPKIRERMRQALGDGPLVIGRGAFLGIGVA